MGESGSFKFLLHLGKNPRSGAGYAKSCLSKEVRGICKEQLKDENLEKIICYFECNDKGVNYENWTELRYLMSQYVLYRVST